MHKNTFSKFNLTSTFSRNLNKLCSTFKVDITKKVRKKVRFQLDEIRFPFLCSQQVYQVLYHSNEVKEKPKQKTKHDIKII